MIRHLIKLLWNRKKANFLLIMEIFVSFVVLFAVALVGFIYLNRVQKPTGFQYDDVLVVSIDSRDFDREVTHQEDAGVTRDLIAELEYLPETRFVGATSMVPFELAMSGSNLEYQGRSVDGGYLDVTDEVASVLAIEVVQGRWFDPSDDALDWNPVVINRQMADELFKEEDPLGKIVHEEPQRRVIGVVETFRKGGKLGQMQPFFFRRINLNNPDTRRPHRVIIRVEPGTPAEFEARAIKLMQAKAPDWVFQIETLDQVRIRNQKMALAPFVVGALVAGFLMVMVVLGMIGVFWQSVIGRTDEIGLRRAVGCPRNQIYRQLLAEVLLVTAVGTVLGSAIVIQLPLLGVLGSVGWNTVVWSLLTAFVLMCILALISGLYPAWCAAGIQPATALHDD